METSKTGDIKTLLTSKDVCCNQYGNTETGRDNADNSKDLTSTREPQEFSEPSM